MTPEGASAPRRARASWKIHAAAPVAAALLLFAAYVATLAPDITFWDSSELIAAAHSLGIPHPPGTPLYVLLAHVWLELLSPLSTPVAVNSLSAATTALAAGSLAWLFCRATRRTWAALGAALTAGAMSTVWLDANEAEVYAASLLLAMAMLLAAERAGAGTGAGPDAGRGATSSAGPRFVTTSNDSFSWTLLTAYLMALAVPLHLSALVAAPAAIVLAVNDGSRSVNRERTVMLSGSFFVVAGVGIAKWSVAAIGLVLLAAWPAFAIGERRRRMKAALATLLVVMLGISVVTVLPIRSLHAPLLDSGSPTTWAALWDVLGRRQYELHGLWPRQAPFWAQLANLFEYADWQIALGLSPGVAPSWARTPFTLAFALLGVYGALRHRALDARSWRALLVLLASASVGLVVYLNFKAGASFGYGVLPDAIPHEVRERDYFFSLAFFVWGAWSGFGAVLLCSRFSRSLMPLGIVLAAFPLALNWRAVDRSREPVASSARRVAEAILWSAPPRAVLLTWGDNDSFPLWYMQIVEGKRSDVTVVVAPLLGAGWYRAQLARRDSLLPEPAMSPTTTIPGALRGVVERARETGRPTAAVITADSAELWSLADDWVLHGVVFVRGQPTRTTITLPGARAPVDTLVARAFVERFGFEETVPGDGSIDPAPGVMSRLLNCPGAMLASERLEARVDSLASGCKWR